MVPAVRRQYPLLVAVSGQCCRMGADQAVRHARAFRHTVENAVYVDYDYQGRESGRPCSPDFFRL